MRSRARGVEHALSRGDDVGCATIVHLSAARWTCSKEAKAGSEAATTSGRADKIKEQSAALTSE